MCKLAGSKKNEKNTKLTPYAIDPVIFGSLRIKTFTGICASAAPVPTYVKVDQFPGIKKGKK